MFDSVSQWPYRKRLVLGGIDIAIAIARSKLSGCGVDPRPCRNPRNVAGIPQHESAQTKCFHEHCEGSFLGKAIMMKVWGQSNIPEPKGGGGQLRFKGPRAGCYRSRARISSDSRGSLPNERDQINALS